MGKLSDLLAKHRQARPRSQEGAGEGPERTSWRGRLLKGTAALLVIALVGGATYALFHLVLWARIPNQMAGKWLVHEGELHGATLEFFRNGTMVGTVNLDGRKATIQGKVEVEGDKLHITSIHPLTKKQHTDTQTIRSLTDSEFILVDRKGTVIRMERLH
ncbi:MAG: hypothetical protein L0Z62_31270 [Gemmataceae bacterium]|nr:hypothetical protein [Gemmataceae bacterium]